MMMQNVVMTTPWDEDESLDDRLDSTITNESMPAHDELKRFKPFAVDREFVFGKNVIDFGR